MSKLTKAESARINGAKSRGAVTPEGRAKSSMNAVRHGMTAKTLILCNENQDQFLEIMNAYIEYWQPSNQVEVDLIMEMVGARWRLRRTWRYETALLDLEMDDQAPEFEKRFHTYDEEMRGGLAFASLVDKSKGLSTALRFDIHLSRTFRKAIDELRLMRKVEVEHALACSSDGENQHPTDAHPAPDTEPPCVSMRDSPTSNICPDNSRRLPNDPTEPPKSPLNGENQHPTGAPPEDEDPPTNIQNPTSALYNGTLCVSSTPSFCP
jgi:hypothetical protein